MRFRLLTACLLATGLVHAEDVQKDHGLQVMDERGCVLGNAGMQAPTLTLMAAAYGESEARKDMALAQDETGAGGRLPGRRAGSDGSVGAQWRHPL